jgi:prolyl-tRNA synthetase
MNKKQFDSAVENVILSYSTEVPGSYIWLPYGLEIRNKIFNKFKSIIKKYGYEEFSFPILVNTKNIERQKKVLNFEENVLYVTTYEGNSKDYYLRPDGIMQISYYVSQILKSKKDLPIKLFNVAPIFRRGRKGVEIPSLLSGQGSVMIEGYGFFASKEEALKELEKAVRMTTKIIKEAYLPFVLVRRPIGGNKPVAEINIGIDVPVDKRTLLAVSLYYHGNIYSKPLEMSYLENENKNYPHMISWGFSERVIGLMLWNHMDEKGIILPPSYAPIKLVIIPLFKKNTNEEEIKEYCIKIQTFLKRIKIISKIDESEGYVGEKIWYWIKRGVPLIALIGEEEVKDNVVTVIIRDIDKKVSLKFDTNIKNEIENILKEYSKRMKERAEIRLKEKIEVINSYESLKHTLKEGKIASIGWCESDDCRAKLEKEFPGEILGVNLLHPFNKEVKCIVCGKKGKEAFFARRL